MMRNYFYSSCRAPIEHVSPHSQGTSASIYPLEDLYYRKAVGYRVVLDNGIERDFETHAHALAWARFMLDLEALVLQ